MNGMQMLTPDPTGSIKLKLNQNDVCFTDIGYDLGLSNFSITYRVVNYIQIFVLL